MPGPNCEKLSCVQLYQVEDKLCQGRNVKSRKVWVNSVNQISGFAVLLNSLLNTIFVSSLFTTSMSIFKYFHNSIKFVIKN